MTLSNLSPNKVADIVASDLQRAGAGSSEQWMLINHWEFRNEAAVQEARRLSELMAYLCGTVTPG